MNSQNERNRLCVIYHLYSLHSKLLISKSFTICSHNPKVQEVDMLHANDYSQMNLEDLNQGIEKSKKLDAEIKKKIVYVWYFHTHNLFSL